MCDSCDAKVGLTDDAVAGLRMTTGLVRAWPPIERRNTESDGWFSVLTTRRRAAAGLFSRSLRGAVTPNELDAANPDSIAYLADRRATRRA